MPTRTAAQFRFGPFRFDSHSQEIYKGDLKLKLQGQPLQILELLLCHPGELVTREEIRRSLWPGDTFVDFEHSLNTAVRKLRQVLGDEAETPKFIETLPKRGYRFMGEVSSEESWQQLAAKNGVPPSVEKIASASSLANVPPPEVAPIAVAQKPGAARLTWWVLLLTGGAVTIIVFWGVHKLRSSGERQLFAAPLTAYAGAELDPDLSPDGKMVAFTWDEGKADFYAVYVKMVSGNENAVRIGPARSACPAWSPDGNSVAFAYAGPSQRGIYVASPLGGSLRMLFGQPAVLYDATPTRCSLSWSSDGQLLTFSAAELSPYAPQAIYVLNLREQRITQLTHPPGGIFGDYAARFSPDDKTVAFVRWTSVDVDEVFTMSLSGGEPQQVTHDNRIVRGIAWTRDGRELLVSSGASGGRLSLSRLRLSDGLMRPLSLPTFNAWAPTMSRYGSRLVFTTADWGTDMWEVDLQGKAPEIKVYSSTLNDANPIYSPDGAMVVFMSLRSGTSTLYRANRDGTGVVPLASVPGLGSPQWSPDGKWISFDAEPTALASLFVVPASGGPVTRLTDGKAKDVVPRWSGDSKWIYFSSNRTGSWQIFKIPASGGPAIQVTQGGGLFGQESLDGKRLYFLKPEKNASRDINVPGIWVKPFATGIENVLKGTEGIQTRQFAVSKTGIYFLHFPNGIDSRAAVGLFRWHADQPTILRTLDHDIFGAPSISIAPDENSMLYTSIDYSADLMLVENFR